MAFLLIVTFIIVFYFGKPWIQKIVGWVLGRFSYIPMSSEKKLFYVFVRESILNWYIWLVLILIWFLLYFTEVGNDMIDSYLSKIKVSDLQNGIYPLFEIWGSYLLLVFCLLLMSLTIWTFPFFMYSDKKREEILTKKNYEKFYLSTKVRAFMAMLPFLTVSNAFLAFSRSDNGIIKIILTNMFFFALFIFIVYLFSLDITRRRKSGKQKKTFSASYLNLIIKIFFLIILLSLIFLLIEYAFSSFFGINSLSWFIAVYVFISSAIVFRLMYFSSEPDEKVIYLLVRKMLSDKNRSNSRIFYLSIFFLSIGIVLYYYFIPSLEPTNALYILITVFSFYIIYLDYFRNLFNNKSGFWKITALFATILFLVLPFVSPSKQFAIPLVNQEKKNISYTTFEERLHQRYNYINQYDSTGNIFIVCAMGGGSRAGYITASVLKAIDQIDTSFWSHSICYSTVSGGSVGLYNYFLDRQQSDENKKVPFLREIYQRNYNSAGLFGLVIGDALESLFGNFLTIPKGWVQRERTASGYYDRNFRIRRDYDYMVQNALSENPSHNYLTLTFYPWKKNYSARQDTFQTFFKAHPELPVHLINTFEVNSGRRTVISPFPVRDENLFPNTILPLQNTAFDKDILQKDIYYRDAVNLSELFPLISAASRIGFHKDAQFVDGGYYENYGLATGLDVFYFLRDSLHIASARIKFVLIKNSTQQPADAGHQSQLFAPLVGVMQAPFTGHANNLLAQSKRILSDSNNIFVIEFNAEKKKVPLTRSLTKRHIDSMNTFVTYILNDKKYHDSLKNFIKF